MTQRSYMDTRKNYVNAAALTADVNGDAIDTSAYEALSFQAVWTGTGAPLGNFRIEVSQDKTTWNTYASSTVAAGGVAGSNTWEITRCVAQWYRFKYARTSDGTGATVTVNVTLRS